MAILNENYAKNGLLGTMGQFDHEVYYNSFLPNKGE
jgi:hypothetical protein